MGNHMMYEEKVKLKNETNMVIWLKVPTRVNFQVVVDMKELKKFQPL